MKRTCAAVILALVMASGIQPVWSRCGGGIGKATSAEDMQRFSIRASIRSYTRGQLAGVKRLPRELGDNFEQQIREAFAQRKVSYILKVAPDGSVIDVSTLNSSGLREVDERGQELVRSAAPYHVSLLGEKRQSARSYLVEFPEVDVQYVREVEFRSEASFIAPERVGVAAGGCRISSSATAEWQKQLVENIKNEISSQPNFTELCRELKDDAVKCQVFLDRKGNPLKTMISSNRPPDRKHDDLIRLIANAAPFEPMPKIWSLPIISFEFAGLDIRIGWRSQTSRAARSDADLN